MSLIVKLKEVKSRLRISIFLTSSSQAKQIHGSFPEHRRETAEGKGEIKTEGFW